MKYLNLVIFFCLFLLLAMKVAAVGNCAHETNTTKALTCYQALLTEEDQRLNKTYQELRDKLSQSGQNLLRDGQRAWLQFRDADCAWAIHAATKKKNKELILTVCLANQTSLRADELETYLERYR